MAPKVIHVPIDPSVHSDEWVGCCGSSADGITPRGYSVLRESNIGNDPSTIHHYSGDFARKRNAAQIPAVYDDYSSNPEQGWIAQNSTTPSFAPVF